MNELLLKEVTMTVAGCGSSGRVPFQQVQVPEVKEY
jgi:hypothetical protein